MKKKIIILIVTIVVVVIGLFISNYLPGGDGIVAQTELPDGTQILMTQKYSSGGEPYIVSLYFKEPEASWGWCYLDHQDTRWRKGKIEYDPSSDKVRIWKGKVLRGVLDRSKGMYYRPNVSGWETKAPQEYRDPPFVNEKLKSLTNHSTLR